MLALLSGGRRYKFSLLSRIAWTGATRCCMACRRTCRGRCSLCRTLLLVCLPTHSVETTSLRFCVKSFGCQYRDEWSSRLHVWHTDRLHQQDRRTYLPTFNSSLSTVVVISAHLPTEHSLFHAHLPLSATEASLSQDRVCGTVYRLL